MLWKDAESEEGMKSSEASKCEGGRVSRPGSNILEPPSGKNIYILSQNVQFVQIKYQCEDLQYKISILTPKCAEFIVKCTLQRADLKYLQYFN